ncbi:hypothetical protein, partial [Intestinibacter sp.]
SEDDLEKMISKYEKIEAPGKYIVLKTGLSYNKEIVFKAEFEKIVEEEQKDITNKDTEKDNQINKEIEDESIKK